MKAYYLEEIDIPLIAESLEVFQDYVRDNPDSYFTVKHIESFKTKYYSWLADYIEENND